MKPFDARLQLVREPLQQAKLPEADEAAQRCYDGQDECRQTKLCMQALKVTFPMNHLQHERILCLHILCMRALLGHD